MQFHPEVMHTVHGRKELAISYSVYSDSRKRRGQTGLRERPTVGPTTHVSVQIEEGQIERLSGCLVGEEGALVLIFLRSPRCYLPNETTLLTILVIRSVSRTPPTLGRDE